MKRLTISKASVFVLSVLLAASMVGAILFSTSIGHNALASETTISNNWRVHENTQDTLTLSGVGDRGVGRVEYYRIPPANEQERIGSINMGNSVIVDIDHNPSHRWIWVKFDTNILFLAAPNGLNDYIHVHGHHADGRQGADPWIITSGTNTQIGAFHGWNAIITEHPVDTMRVLRISIPALFIQNNTTLTALQFVFGSTRAGLAGDSANPYFFEFMGIEMTATDVMPEFVTDPCPDEVPYIGAIANEQNSDRFTITTQDNITTAVFDGQGSQALVAPIQNWREAFRSNFYRIHLRVAARENTRLRVSVDGTFLEEEGHEAGNFREGRFFNDSPTNLFFPMPDEISNPSSIYLWFDTESAANTGATEITFEIVRLKGSLWDISIGNYFSPTIVDGGFRLTYNTVGFGWRRILITMPDVYTSLSSFAFSIQSEQNIALGVRYESPTTMLRQHSALGAGSHTLIFSDIHDVAGAAAIELWRLRKNDYL